MTDFQWGKCTLNSLSPYDLIMAAQWTCLHTWVCQSLHHTVPGPACFCFLSKHSDVSMYSRHALLVLACRANRDTEVSQQCMGSVFNHVPPSQSFCYVKRLWGWGYQCGLWPWHRKPHSGCFFGPCSNLITELTCNRRSYVLNSPDVIYHHLKTYPYCDTYVCDTYIWFYVCFSIL